MRVQVSALSKAVISSSITICQLGWAKAWKMVVEMVIESGCYEGTRWRRQLFIGNKKGNKIGTSTFTFV